eukprot:scaffold44915_cov81-Phaeocystis_antarctica.AAC.1
MLRLVVVRCLPLPIGRIGDSHSVANSSPCTHCPPMRNGREAMCKVRVQSNGMSRTPQPAGGAGTEHRGSALRIALDGGGEAAQLCRQWLGCAEPGLGLWNVGVEDLKPQALHAVRPANGASRRAPSLADV